MSKRDEYPIEIRTQAIRLAEQVGLANAATSLGIPAKLINQWLKYGVTGKRKVYSYQFKQQAIEQVHQKMILASTTGIGFFDNQLDFKQARDEAIHTTATELMMRTAILEGWMPPVEPVQGEMNKLYPCACCGYLVYGEDPRYSYLICKICCWEADPFQEDLPDCGGGANAYSLLCSRRNFFKVGVAESRFFLPTFKRKSPQEDEIPLGGNAFEAFYASLKPAFSCQCCGFKTFETDLDTASLICPVCLWTVCRPFSEIYQDFPEWKPQFGEVDLEQAQTNYLKFGACLPELAPFVRPPLPEELT